MKASNFLHCAFRSPDPRRIGKFYAEIFECPFYLHPVLSGLGIVMVKVADPNSVYHGLMEFWPLDLLWDGEHARFLRTEPGRPQLPNHIALRVDDTREEIFAALEAKGIRPRYEPRGPGLLIVCFDDPDGNFIEIFPNADTVQLPPDAYCDAFRLDEVMDELARHVEAGKEMDEKGSLTYPLVFRPATRSLSLP